MIGRRRSPLHRRQAVLRRSFVRWPCPHFHWSSPWALSTHWRRNCTRRSLMVKKKDHNSFRQMKYAKATPVITQPTTWQTMTAKSRYGTWRNKLDRIIAEGMSMAIPNPAKARIPIMKSNRSSNRCSRAISMHQLGKMPSLTVFTFTLPARLSWFKV